jgi:endonuclease/exonuclease/phosphatase family metal-dependent hydrolase
LLVTEGAGAAVILAGDFNCKPCGGEDYPALTYERLKSHPLELRSVYNDNIGIAAWLS